MTQVITLKCAGVNNMIDKRSIEVFLRVNGIPPTAPDEEIRSVLLSAKWNANEVDTALVVLKENIKSQETHVDTLHKVFNSDDRLSSSEISSLLGIDVALSSDDILDINDKRAAVTKWQTLSAFTLAVVIALASVTYLMYSEKAGFFYDGSTNSK